MISEAYHIDCMEYMRTVPDKFFDLAVVDPPYGIDADGHRENNRSKLAKTRKYHKALWDQDRPTREYFVELERISVNQIVWGGNHLIDLIGKNSSCWLVWDKVNGTSNFADCELAYTSFDTAVRMFSFMWNGMLQGDPSNGKKMQAHKDRNQKRIHPTEKPIPLYKWIFENYTQPRHKIFDSHMGSQASRIAAYELGLDYWGCEIDPVHFKDGCDRFELMKQTKVEIETYGFARSELSKTNPTLF
jgi:site-specific DNA-methyltransferase (adenine-specific)